MCGSKSCYGIKVNIKRAPDRQATKGVCLPDELGDAVNNKMQRTLDSKSKYLLFSYKLELVKVKEGWFFYGICIALPILLCICITGCVGFCVAKCKGS